MVKGKNMLVFKILLHTIGCSGYESIKSNSFTTFCPLLASQNNRGHDIMSTFQLDAPTI